MTVQEFVAKWRKVQLTERSASQQHFLDLCQVLEQPTPASADPDGAFYTFERGAKKTSGGEGWADVWYREHFAWEYKGKHKDLIAAYQQLLGYREDLENPPLLVVCDMNRFEVHTNFTATAKRVYAFDLDRLAEPNNLDVLRRLFTDPNSLRPDQAAARITEQAAKQFQGVAEGLRVRGIEPHRAAHFLMKVIFCLFAEDIGLLPDGLFTKVLSKAKDEPKRLASQMQSLFTAMATGGDFGADTIHHFNGGLFADADVIELQPDEIRVLVVASSFTWQYVEPSIFGTLFERLLDPSKRSQIGAHYTSKEDILTLLEPVLMAPLRKEWNEVREQCEKNAAKAARKPSRKLVAFTGRRKAGPNEKLLRDFVERLSNVTILDPACGSGNFLYIALHLLLDMEREVIAYGAMNNVNVLPLVRPTQLLGIEINPYAQELAQIAVWIGFLQWKHHNGFTTRRSPVLDPVDTIRRMDAILDLSDPEHPREPEWPAADVIVGNPPFLGNKLMRSQLGAEYCDSVWKLFGDRIPPTSDLCCYWFEKGRAMVKSGRCQRVALLATTGIKQVFSRPVLDRINSDCKIIFGISDRDWILDGAAVRISMIGFGPKETGDVPLLDGRPVPQINADLSTGHDLTTARELDSNKQLCFMGTTKVGSFDIDIETARSLLRSPNPHLQPNSDVVRPFRNGSDLVRVCSHRWIVDFGVGTSIDNAALYAAPLEYLVQNVKPEREKNNDKWRASHWWLLGRTIPDFRRAVARKSRYIATARVAKHRLFVWLDSVILPDSKVIAIAFDDDFHFGVLHSRIHELWTLAKCGWHGLGNDATYNPTTCFETFPFPQPTDAQKNPIAAAAYDLNQLRENWLNPPEWMREDALEFPGSIDGPWARYVTDPNSRGIGTVRYSRLVPRDEDSAKQLAKRTLTRLYNERPTWLQQAHQRLDEAVFAAYGWEPTINDEKILVRLLELNLASSKPDPGSD